MATRQYIGARYVPILANPVEWSSTNTYEPLTIVTYQGNSYTSRQFVPASIDINNTSYWAETGNYNAQVEQYRQEVRTLDGRIDDVSGTVSSNYDQLDDKIDDVSGTVSSNYDELDNKIHNVDNALPNNFYVSEEDLTYLGDLPRIIDGKPLIPQSIHIANNYLYVGYASTNKIDSYLAKLNLETLNIIDYVQCPYYCHFNSLSLYEDEFYSISPETTTINNVTGSFVFVFNKNTLALVRTIFIDSTARANNLIIGPNKAKSGTPIVQGNIGSISSFIDYGYYEHGSSTILQAISLCKYNTYGKSIADGCLLKTSNNSGNLQNVFAYICTRINRTTTTRSNSSIVFVQPNAYIIGEAILPLSVSDMELEGITTDDSYIYFNGSNGKFYKLSLSLQLRSTSINNYVNTIYPFLPNDDSDFYAIFDNGFVPRRFAVSKFGYNMFNNTMPFFGGQSTSTSTNFNPQSEDINVIGLINYSSSIYGLYRLKYVKTDPSSSNCSVYELDQIRTINLGNDISSSNANMDNIRTATDSDFIAFLNEKATSDYHLRIGINCKNSAAQINKYLLMKNVIV